MRGSVVEVGVVFMVQHKYYVSWCKRSARWFKRCVEVSERACQDNLFSNRKASHGVGIQRARGVLLWQANSYIPWS